MREMTRIELPEAKPVADSPADSTPDTPVKVNGSLPHPHPTVEELKGGQAELHIRKEDAKGSMLKNGVVPPTPLGNAPAPNNAS